MRCNRCSTERLRLGWSSVTTVESNSEAVFFHPSVLVFKLCFSWYNGELCFFSYESFKPQWLEWTAIHNYFLWKARVKLRIRHYGGQPFENGFPRLDVKVAHQLLHWTAIHNFLLNNFSSVMTVDTFFCKESKLHISHYSGRQFKIIFYIHKSKLCVGHGFFTLRPPD